MARRVRSVELQTLTRSKPVSTGLPLVGHDGSNLAVLADKESELITPSATSVPGRILSTGGGGTVGTFLHLAVSGFVSIAISASVGEFFFLAERANKTIAFLGAYQGSPRNNFESAPVSGEEGVPPSPTAAAISKLPPAPRAAAGDAAPSHYVEVTPPPPAPQRAPSVEIVPELEQGATPSSFPGYIANSLPIAEQNPALSQGPINAHTQREAVGANSRPNGDKGWPPSVKSHSARFAKSHKAERSFPRHR